MLSFTTKNTHSLITRGNDFENKNWQQTTAKNELNGIRQQEGGHFLHHQTEPPFSLNDIWAVLILGTALKSQTIDNIVEQ